MKRGSNGLIFSASDLIRYLSSPFASWMDRYHIENPGVLKPDEESEDLKLIAATGVKHEANYLATLTATGVRIASIPMHPWAQAQQLTIAALDAREPIVYQAALSSGNFSGYADFVIFDAASGAYHVWDTKLARSPKPYFIIQLCCYSEMLAATMATPLPDSFGVILGNNEQVTFRTADFFAYYQTVKAGFLKLQSEFTGDFQDRPEPLPSADHGRWTSIAEEYFTQTDHLVQVAGITRGQIKKLQKAGILTMAQLSTSGDTPVPKMSAETLAKLVHQARLQCETRTLQAVNPDATACFEVLPSVSSNGEPIGLAFLPPDDPADVFFDIEGYPLMVGGLEYLWGVCTRSGTNFPFQDWWGFDRDGEQKAFEGFIDWVYSRWQANPSMHIYHYAAYEVSAVGRLSNRLDSRVEEVDALRRNNVFVDLYTTVRKGLCVGDTSYSIKKVELLYRPKRANNVASAIGSVVQYANWIESGDPASWQESQILLDIRDYNEEDCVSTGELLAWLRKVASEHGLEPNWHLPPEQKAELKEEITDRIQLRADLRSSSDPIAHSLGDLIDFHRREDKPKYWKFFDLLDAPDEELREDPSCICGVAAEGFDRMEKKSMAQTYRFDSTQECNLRPGAHVTFTDFPDRSMELLSIDQATGELELKATQAKLNTYFDGRFPQEGSLVSLDIIRTAPIPAALASVARGALHQTLHPPVRALLERQPAVMASTVNADNDLVETAIEVARAMDGGCLVIQGPPGTGKTYTASRMIVSLLRRGERVGICSNSHKAIINLLGGCGRRGHEENMRISGVYCPNQANANDPIFQAYPGQLGVLGSAEAIASYSGGILAGTAWLFSHPAMLNEEKQLDYLFIDEAGQVSLANTVAMSRCTRNLVLLGDQMQLEQPIQGSHPGWAGLSALQYALLDVERSEPDRPEFHAVVPPTKGLFLKDSRRMHSSVCRFISDSIYEGRLGSHPDCDTQSIAPGFAGCPHGIVFQPVEHEGNIMQSDEEVAKVLSVYHSLLGSTYTDKNGEVRPLMLEDFLFIAPYNAQVRALTDALPAGARVGSVDKFQGQEAPVCILSMCSSFGEYGSRGLSFILDRNRLNVAISRAMCLAIVVGDPRIAAAAASSIDDMRLINLYSKLVLEHSAG